MVHEDRSGPKHPVARHPNRRTEPVTFGYPFNVTLCGVNHPALFGHRPHVGVHTNIERIAPEKCFVYVKHRSMFQQEAAKPKGPRPVTRIACPHNLRVHHPNHAGKVRIDRRVMSSSV
jgi:hypothetical protein